jgi:hypothetical protein
MGAARPRWFWRLIPRELSIEYSAPEPASGRFPRFDGKRYFFAMQAMFERPGIDVQGRKAVALPPGGSSRRARKSVAPGLVEAG